MSSNLAFCATLLLRRFSEDVAFQLAGFPQHQFKRLQRGEKLPPRQSSEDVNYSTIFWVPYASNNCKKGGELTARDDAGRSSAAGVALRHVTTRLRGVRVYRSRVSGWARDEKVAAHVIPFAQCSLNQFDGRRSLSQPGSRQEARVWGRKSQMRKW